MQDPHAYEDDAFGWRENFHCYDDYKYFCDAWSFSFELPEPPSTYPARIKYTIEDINGDGIETLDTFYYIPYE